VEIIVEMLWDYEQEPKAIEMGQLFMEAKLLKINDFTQYENVYSFATDLDTVDFHNRKWMFWLVIVQAPCNDFSLANKTQIPPGK
jgi:hypothetical protein